MKWQDLPITQEVVELLYDMWNLGWHERNSGNMSLRLSSEEFKGADNLDLSAPWIDFGFEVPGLADEYFLISGSGEYFRNVRNPNRVLGIIQINKKGTAWRRLGGFVRKDGSIGRPTSELPAHMMSHEIRKKIAGDRVILHTHATNLIALTGLLPLDEQIISSAIWNACTESIVVIPQGIGVIPWMMPGSLEIGRATCEKMKEFSLILWAHHGVYGAGQDLDDVFGLVETAEKSAEVWIKIQSIHPPLQNIGSKNLEAIADQFKVKARKGFLN